MGAKAGLLLLVSHCLFTGVLAGSGDGLDIKKLASELVTYYKAKAVPNSPMAPLFTRDVAVAEEFIVWLGKWDERFDDSLSVRLSSNSFSDELYKSIFHEEVFHLWRRFTVYKANKVKFRLTIVPYHDARLDAVAQKMEVFYYEIYPLIYERYHKKDSPESLQVNIRFDPKLVNNPAYTAADTITMSSDWFIKHPDDIGAFTHEMTHLLQKYYDHAPGWLIEGMSDYIRFVYQGIAHEQFALPASMKGRSYRDAYRTTAKFLVWLNVLSPGFSDFLHHDMFYHRYSSDLFVKRFGTDLDSLWKQFAAENDGPRF